MVQFINIPAPRSALLKEQIGHSVGKGLANFANTYYANKAIEKVVNDPSLKKAPVSERLERMTTALQPFGEVGEGLLQKRLGIEQQKAQEQQQQIQQKKNLIANKLFSGQQLEPDEESVLEPSERVNIEKARAMQAKAAQPKAPSGGLTGQAVPPEVSQAIGQVLQQAQQKNLDANQLGQAFDQAGIPPIYSNKYIENKRRQEEKVNTFEPEAHKLAAKHSDEIRNEIVRDYEAAEAMNMRLDRQIELADSDKLPTPLMVKTLDSLNLPISVLNNPEAEEFEKIQADYTKDVSKIYPGVIKNFEIETYLKTIPNLLNSDQGKRIVARNNKILNEGKILRYNALKDILKENKGVIPPNLDIEIQERIGPQRAALAEQFREGINNGVEQAIPKIKMIKDGVEYDVPINQIEKAQGSGAKIKNA